MQENVTPTHLIQPWRVSFSPYVTHRPQPDMDELEIRHNREWRMRLEKEVEDLKKENEYLKNELSKRIHCKCEPCTSAVQTVE